MGGVGEVEAKTKAAESEEAQMDAIFHVKRLTEHLGEKVRKADERRNCAGARFSE